MLHFSFSEYDSFYLWAFITVNFWQNKCWAGNTHLWCSVLKGEHGPKGYIMFMWELHESQFCTTWDFILYGDIYKYIYICYTFTEHNISILTPLKWNEFTCYSIVLDICIRKPEIFLRQPWDEATGWHKSHMILCGS